MSARDPSRRFSVVATVVAAAAFAAVIAAFAAQVVSFGRDVERWARRDLKTQAELTAAGLAAPLRTQDFRRLREVAAALELKGLVLRVRSPGGGVLYDGGRGEPMLEESAAAGEHSVAVAIRREQVFEPFRRAVALFALAALVGALGMFVVFFALYRQRVRIRELARLERYRREFVADVSHEIKTPLTGILGAAEMIGAADDSARPRLAAMIAKESKRLNALVQQILDLARLDREGVAPERARTDLAGLVREILEERRAEAESRGVELVFRGNGEVFADCDATLVAEAVSNLVGNAVRHSGSRRRHTARRLRWRTMASASRRSTSSASSSVFTGSTRRARRSRAGQGWVWRSSAASPASTAATCASSRSRRTAVASSSACDR